MKIRLIAVVMLVFLMAACSSFRETGTSEDGSVRQIMTEHTEELEIPADPERVVLFRSIDAGNAELLGGSVVGVNEGIGGTPLAEEHLDDVAYLEHGDLEALREMDPDLIITFTPDEYVFEYEDIAPTVQVNYNTSSFSPFRDRLYLTHLFNLGVILNRQEEAERIGDEWLEEETRIQREAGEVVMGKQAMVLVESGGSLYAYGQYSSFGTEAVYDVLGLGMDAELDERLASGPVEMPLEALQDYTSDYIFVNLASEDAGIQREIAEAAGIPQENVIIQDYDAYRLNDLISVRQQAEEIADRLSR